MRWAAERAARAGRFRDGRNGTGPGAKAAADDLQTAARQTSGLGPWRTLLHVGALGRQEGKEFELHYSR